MADREQGGFPRGVSGLQSMRIEPRGGDKGSQASWALQSDGAGAGGRLLPLQPRPESRSDPFLPYLRAG
jgi:hypothetical protein